MASPRNPTDRVSLAELTKALRRKDGVARFLALEAYGRRRPPLDAVPLLVKALHDDEDMVVRQAAAMLAKVGPAAGAAVEDLIVAAVRVDPVLRLPQAYPDCLRALVAIRPDHDELPSLIRTFIGVDNWGFIRPSLEALKAIGTPESLGLLKRAAAFWLPELNAMQRRVVESVLHS